MSARDLHIENLATARPPVPQVNGYFVDPRQLARAMRDISDGEENWWYVGSHHIGGHGDVHLVACGDETKPLVRDTHGRWSLGFRDQMHYGNVDAESTKILLRFAQRKQQMETD